ncbi:MAG: folate-binding protein, partial [PS1 clade bacterium]|nr:folate-binding protein [PS1 clade bacterium]
QGQSEMPPGSIFPLEYGFEAANAIDFQKGCFVGQEVTSRTHRKGSLRKKLRPIEIDGATGNHGDKLLTAAERVGGELVALRDGCGLALIREDALAEPLTLNGAPVRLTL